MRPCAICGGEHEPAYHGPVRQGTFGRSINGQVWRCRGCGVEFLPPAANLDDYYASDAYRTDVGEQADVNDYFRRHDSEQMPRLALLESTPLRGRVIADVGCGGGSFLDCVRGLASGTVAVEPMVGYHASLADRGHRVYASAAAACADWSGRVDIAACFSVVEHVDDPLAFLRQIRELLVPGGLVVLSTPNRRDVLLESGCSAYRNFFYRTVHTYYFDASSLRHLASAAGFAACDVRFVHRFGFGNYLAWLRDGRPTQHAGPSPLGSEFDKAWRLQLEEAGVSDYLYAFLKR
jgi:SAM-dependent methyltransferase